LSGSKRREKADNQPEPYLHSAGKHGATSLARRHRRSFSGQGSSPIVSVQRTPTTSRNAPRHPPCPLVNGAVSLVRDRAPNGSLLGPPPPQPRDSPHRKRKRHGGTYQSSQRAQPRCCRSAVPRRRRGHISGGGVAPVECDRRRADMGSKYTRGCCGWMIVAALMATLAMFAIMKRRPGGRHLKPLPVPGPPGAIDSKYGDALGVALQFFQVQKCEYRCFTEPCIAGRAGLSFKGFSLRRRGPCEFCLWRCHVSTLGGVA
jgi:hypothetical protein